MSVHYLIIIILDSKTDQHCSTRNTCTAGALDFQVLKGWGEGAPNPAGRDMHEENTLIFPSCCQIAINMVLWIG